MALEEPAAALDVPLETLIQVAARETDLAARLRAIGALGSPVAEGIVQVTVIPPH